MRNETDEKVVGEHAWKDYKAFTEDTIKYQLCQDLIL